MKSFTVRSHHKFETKDLMQKRDQCRAQMKGASSMERNVLHKKYKTLRNKATANIRKDNIKINSERMLKAKNVNEIWKVAKDITNPHSENNWSMQNPAGNTTCSEVLW